MLYPIVGSRIKPLIYFNALMFVKEPLPVH